MDSNLCSQSLPGANARLTAVCRYQANVHIKRADKLLRKLLVSALIVLHMSMPK